MTVDFRKAFQWPLQLPEIRAALTTAFDSGHWGKYEGDNTQQLTNSLLNYFSSKFVRLCSSGTIAIEIALRAVGTKTGDEVILAGYDFPGNFRSIEATGAIPVLADVDLDTWSLSSSSFAECLSARTKAVIVSHLHGGTADIQRIAELAKQRGVFVIEDICQCPGATLENQKLGTFADVGVISFGGSKLLSAGRGGALITKDESIFQRAKIFCDRGNDAFPLSELQAAVLVPQLDLLDELTQKRMSAVQAIIETVQQSELLSTISPKPGEIPGFYKVPLLLNPQVKKQEMINRLRDLGITIDHGFRGFAKRSARRSLAPVPLPHSIHVAADTLVLHHPCLLSAALPQILAQIVKAAEDCAA